jgi:hypothetical protein
MSIDELVFLSLHLKKDDAKAVHEWQEEIMREAMRMRNTLCVQWSPRGVGSNWNIPDLVTGLDDGKLHPDMSGFVKSKAEGQLAVVIFGDRARLDYRESEPNWIQVKVSAQEEVLYELEKLVRENNGLLTPDIVNKAKRKDERFTFNIPLTGKETENAV